MTPDEEKTGLKIMRIPNYTTHCNRYESQSKT